jgi:tetratricopeptide (TPR) repeat protein
MQEQKSNDNNHRIEKLHSFLQANPNDCFLLHALALENMKLNQINDAIAIFYKVLGIDEKYIGSYYHLGKCLEETNKTNEAIDVYKKGVSIAQAIGDRHSAGELQGALEFLIEDDE